MANRDIVAIGASAGGVDALQLLASGIARGFPASIFIVLHLPSEFDSNLDSILSGAGPLPASFAVDGEPWGNGRIYIGRAGRHLLLDEGRIHLGFGPAENRVRPSIDPLFRSAALCCSGRTIGVVLTGTQADGASGLRALKGAGGITIVQDPADAEFSEMPRSALNLTNADHVVTLKAMPALLERLVRLPAQENAPVPDGLKREVEIARTGRSSVSVVDRLGQRSVWTCPDCHGVLWEISDGDQRRYRCHTGHAYTPEMLSLALDESLGRALGSALRALQERVSLARKLGDAARSRDRPRSAQDWVRKAEEYAREVEVIEDAMRRIDEIADRIAKSEEEKEEPSRPARKSR
jgi:two-component system chemotaxis response regulator CheB